MNVKKEQCKSSEQDQSVHFASIPTVDSFHRHSGPANQINSISDGFQRLAIPTPIVGGFNVLKAPAQLQVQNPPLIMRHFYTVPSTTVIDVERSDGKTEKVILPLRFKFYQFEQNNSPFLPASLLASNSGISSQNLAFKISPFNADHSFTRDPIPRNPPPEASDSRKLEFASPKIKYVRRLYNLLIKIFIKRWPIEPHEMELTRVELRLFLEFIRRKFKNMPYQLDRFHEFGAFEITDLIMRARGEKSAKRIEERKKFVYKLTLKKLKKEFYDSELYKSHLHSRDHFYRYYFDTLAQQKDLAIENFFDPLNQQNKDRVYRTLSNLYLALIFESPRFKHDFLLYMQSENFVTDYQKSIDKKIEKLLLKWEELLEKETQELIVMKNITEYFTYNRQCKLPWTAEEITHAARSFLKFTNPKN
jgi:hypothetical protein